MYGRKFHHTGNNMADCTTLHSNHPTNLEEWTSVIRLGITRRNVPALGNALVLTQYMRERKGKKTMNKNKDKIKIDNICL